MIRVTVEDLETGKRIMRQGVMALATVRMEDATLVMGMGKSNRKMMEEMEAAATVTNVKQHGLRWWMIWLMCMGHLVRGMQGERQE